MTDPVLYRERVAPRVMEMYARHCNGVNLVKHQLDSFCDFVSRRIPNIVASCNPIDVPYEYVKELGCYQNRLIVTMQNPRLTRPSIVEKDGSTTRLTPDLCRLRGISYSAGLYVDVHVVGKSLVPNDQDPSSSSEYSSCEKTIKNVPIGRVPIMVGSQFCLTHSIPLLKQSECRYDYGGYFIINGTEKVVISTDRMAENQTFVFANNKVSSTSYSHTAEIRSIGSHNDSSQTIKSLILRISSKANQFGRYIRVSLPHTKQDVPVVVLFRALGIESDRAIVDMVTRGALDAEKLALTEFMAGSIAEGAGVVCAREAVETLARGMMAAAPGASVAAGATAQVEQQPAAASKSKLDYVRTVLSRDILPHVGPSFNSKAVYLAYMVRRLLRCVSGTDDVDDRDSYVNKRIDTTGVMLASLLRLHYVRMVKEFRNSIGREMAGGGWKPSGGFINVINRVNVTKHIKQAVIESGMKYALATGNWNVKGLGGGGGSAPGFSAVGGGGGKQAGNACNSSRKQGVAQVLNRLSYVATLSHLRRINTPMEKNGKMVPPRKLHNSQWGVICPSETPEGASVGLVKNMAMSASITGFSHPDVVRRNMRRLGLVEDDDGGDGVSVFLNGAIVGSHRDPVALVEALRRMRRACVINVFTSVVLDPCQRVVRVNTEAGRMVRPLWVVDAGTGDIGIGRELGAVKDFWQLVWRGMVEFLDVAEAATSMIALDPTELHKGRRGPLRAFRYTHMEIDPACILGVVASCIPFSDHNQAPRNTYQSAMCKQAIGVNVSSFGTRFDTVNHVLHYPQKALVQTRYARLVHADQLPNGINCMVAVMAFSGYNQEDSVLINKAAVQRGLFTSTMFKTFREQNNRNHANGEEEFFCKPDPLVTRNMKPANYDMMNDAGFVPENTVVREGDVIIGKCMPQKVGASLVYRDNSIPYKGTDVCVVDRNCYNDNYFHTVNGDGYTFAKTRVRCVMEPVIGDKFSSRHAQKGTCGMILDEWDMPFTEDGIVPDIVMNTHAVPSRMTIAQLLEGVLAKAACVVGAVGDGSPFQTGDFAGVGDALKSAGLDPHGNDSMRDPVGGRVMTMPVFFTPCFYQRLKHLSGQKIHSRAANGPVVLLTRQPTEGRSREGALRMGTMETHVLIAHGIQQFLKERLVDCSDNFRVFACARCGYIADVNTDRGVFQCRGCGIDAVAFSEVRIPYAAKLLSQEMTSLAVGSRFVVPSP